MEAAWVDRLQLLQQLELPTPFNSVMGTHWPGRGCLGKCCYSGVTGSQGASKYGLPMGISRRLVWRSDYF